MITQDIQINAASIWYLLCEKGRRLSLREIREITKYHESLIHSAIGWLSKEGKINISNTPDGSVYVELKSTFGNIYY